MSRAQGLPIELANRLSAALAHISQVLAGADAEDPAADTKGGLRAAVADVSFALKHLPGAALKGGQPSDQLRNPEAIVEDEQLGM